MGCLRLFADLPPGLVLVKASFGALLPTHTQAKQQVQTLDYFVSPKTLPKASHRQHLNSNAQPLKVWDAVLRRVGEWLLGQATCSLHHGLLTCMWWQKGITNIYVFVWKILEYLEIHKYLITILSLQRPRWLREKQGTETIFATYHFVSFECYSIYLYFL